MRIHYQTDQTNAHQPCLLDGSWIQLATWNWERRQFRKIGIVSNIIKDRYAFTTLVVNRQFMDNPSTGSNSRWTEERKGHHSKNKKWKANASHSAAASTMPVAGRRRDNHIVINKECGTHLNCSVTLH